MTSTGLNRSAGGAAGPPDRRGSNRGRRHDRRQPDGGVRSLHQRPDQPQPASAVHPGLPEPPSNGRPGDDHRFPQHRDLPPLFLFPRWPPFSEESAGASIHQTFYAARLLNLLAAVAVLVTALALFRTGRTVAATLLLFPTAVSQYAAVSQDGLLITVGALAAALASRPLSERRAAGVEIAWITALLALLFVTRHWCRSPFCPGRSPTPTRPWSILPTLGLVTVTAGWSLYADDDQGALVGLALPLFDDGAVDRHPDVPGHLRRVLWRTMSDLGHGYLLQAVAVFGLLDVFLPGWVYGVAALGIGLALLRDGHTASGGNGLFRGTGVIAVAAPGC
ncbi:DUF2142 domain-containing protein [Azospirillum argentinense]|uniref:DUF2142 domain-containing protein n=1 Tax=Azospirillum brasilense TaxID=192 RepID=A0A4D8QA17_AZOBR|nr:DUF2142 domain-containing protein [Azospirillum argentinense]QCO07247.1 DUF2142 domain-containing protein [Azospirillum argentinense]